MSHDPLTVVMYHYVRPIKNSLYPGIKGLEVEDFDGQLDFIQRHYTPISPFDLVAHHRSGTPLPRRPLMLSFDDGFKEHQQYVAPSLTKRGISAAFYPPSSAVLDRTVLDVHKIHYILSVVKDRAALVEQLENLLSENTTDYPISYYRDKYWHESRWDSAETRYFKRMLQFALSSELRSDICSTLFKKYVSADEKDFADTLYLSVSDLQQLVDEGMHVGSHSHHHVHMEYSTVEQQAKNIEDSLEMLEAIENTPQWFSFCYPYGSYNQTTIELLSQRDCAFALTTKVGLVSNPDMDTLEIARIDTNDLPTNGNSEPGYWTNKVLERENA